MANDVTGPGVVVKRPVDEAEMKERLQKLMRYMGPEGYRTTQRFFVHPAHYQQLLEQYERLRCTPEDFACSPLVEQANCTDTPHGTVVRVDYKRGTFTVRLP